MLFKNKINILHEIFGYKIFWLGLIIKIGFALFFASSYLTELFIPFINYFVSSDFSNPYLYFFNQEKKNIFPYPTLMLLITSLPRILFGFATDWSSISPLVLFLFRLPVLIADLLILFILLILIKKNYYKVVMFYWLSPVLIYINYIHGQLDVFPILFLFFSLYLMFKGKYLFSSIFLGLSIATKTNIIMVIPFYFLYLLYQINLTFRDKFLNFILVASTFIIINLFYLFNYEFIQIVFHNQEQLKLLNLSLNFFDDTKVFVAPFAYCLLLIYAINLKVYSKDVYFMFLGFSFGIVSLTISPMPGWYYWIMPFFIYFYSKKKENNNYFSYYLLFGLQIFYLIYFISIENSDLFEIFKLIDSDFAEKNNLYNHLESLNLNADKFVSLSFTLLQVFLLANCIYIYKSGIKNYSNYKIFSNPYLLGLCGDSGAGKTTISNSLNDIFKSKNTTQIRGDDMHKWERGDNNWKKQTHLNPKSNFLHNEISYLNEIKNKKEIKRRIYDHGTGKFTLEKRFQPRNLIIFEGLHSFYLKQMRDLFDLKIFINPSEEIRRKWKIERDIRKRKHSTSKILKQLRDRKEDSVKFIKTQKKYADIIIEYYFDRKRKLKKENNLNLHLTLLNSFYVEPIVREIENNTNIKCYHEYLEDDKQSIKLKGKISEKQINKIANSLDLNSNLDDLGVNDPKWNINYLGLIQIIITYCIIKNLEHDK